MLDTLKLKYFQGRQYIPDIRNAQMREQFRGLPILTKGPIDETICPTGALKANPLSIDLGKCSLCGACQSENVKFTNCYKLASTQRETLIITENMTEADYEKVAIKARKEIRKIFSKSLKLRQVSAAGCNGCEMELNACSNCNFDMGRFGIDFVASPRHADGLVITGPISENMAYALEDAYKSTPDPKVVILAGTCAISGGVFQESSTLNREFLEKYPIDLYIPGCPVHPLTFINGVLDFITKK